MSSSKRKQIALTSDSMFIVWTRFINMLACDNITPLFGICIFTGGTSRLEPYVCMCVCIYVCMHACMFAYVFIIYKCSYMYICT